MTQRKKDFDNTKASRRAMMPVIAGGFVFVAGFIASRYWPLHVPSVIAGMAVLIGTFFFIRHYSKT